MKKVFLALFALVMLSGSVFSQTLTTTLPQIFSYPGEEVIIPVSVGNFNGVASVSLLLSYDNSVLQFVGMQNVNTNLTGSFITNVMPGGIGEELILSWFALVPVNIGTGTMLELKFNYTGGSSSLKWDTLTYGNCQYTNLMGDPIAASFADGLVTEVSANTTYVDQVLAIPATEILVPVTVASFNNVAEIHLSLSHDHSVISYQSTDYINPVFPASSISVTNGGNIVHINWQSTSPVNIGDDTLCVLRFMYNGGSSLLEWDTISTGACYYKDANGNLLPGTFVSGAVNPALVQLGIASASMCNGSSVTLPVSVGGANDIESFSLKLAYNNAVIDYTSFQNLNPVLSAGTFSITENNGVLSIEWTSSSPVNIGTSMVFELNFQTIVNNGGLSDLVWSNTECTFHNPDGLSFPLNLVAGSLMITPFINIGNDQEVCIYHPVTLFAGALFASYLWSTGDTTAEIVVDSTMGSGIYSVTVTDMMGCSGYDEMNLIFVPCTGINEVEEVKPLLSVYPNPVSGNSISCNLSNFSGDAVVSISDLTGRTVLQKLISNLNSKHHTEEINLDLNNGIYLLRVQTDSHIVTERLIVE